MISRLAVMAFYFGHQEASLTDWISAISTAFIAVLTCVYAVVSVKTMKKISEQSRIAGDAAAAARLSADASVNAERAWVTIDLQSDVLTPLSTHNNKTSFHATCLCTNSGKTPAVVLENRFVFKATANALPEHPDLTNADVFYHGTIVLNAGEEQEYAVRPECDGTRLATALYGRVRYKDVFSSQIRETYFAFQITPLGAIDRLPGYPEYNRLT